MFLVTVPGPGVSTVLEMCRKNGVGVIIGTIILTTLDCIKPRFGKGFNLFVSYSYYVLTSIFSAGPKKKIPTNSEGGAVDVGEIKKMVKHFPYKKSSA